MAILKLVRSIPLLARVLAVTAVLSSTMAVLISVSSDKAAGEVAKAGVRGLASEVTELVALGISGAVRFKKVEEINAQLQRLTEFEHKNFLAAAVYDREGVLLTSIHGTNQDGMKQLAEHALTVVQTGTESRSEDGFLVAVPVRFGDTGETIGSIGTLWTPEPFLATLTEGREEQALYAALLLIGSLILAAIFLLVSFKRPLAAVIDRVENLADGNLDADVPGVNNGSEIGALARAVESLRATLQQNEAVQSEAALLSAGFMASSRGMFMTDGEFRITHFNPAFSELAATHGHNIRSYWQEFDSVNLHGLGADLFRAPPGKAHGHPSTIEYPYDAVLQMGEAAMSVRVNAVQGKMATSTAMCSAGTMSPR